jgi:hypothetical protein
MHNRMEQLEDVQLRYDVYRGGKLVDTLLTQMQVRYYGKYELELLLKTAGFSKVRTYGSFKDKEAEDGDEVVTFRCFK